MIKKFFFILFFSLISFSSFSHVDHYKNLKKFEFNLYRNDNLIGQHIYFFEKDGNKLIVKSEINFTIKKLGIELYKYNANGTETYIDEKYISFSPTIQYELPLKYKFISTSFFLSPNILQSISSDTATENQQLIYWNTGLRISIN